MRARTLMTATATMTLTGCCAFGNLSEVRLPGLVAAGGPGEYRIYSGPVQTTYRVCYDGPGSVEIRNESGTIATLEPSADSHATCTDVRATSIIAVAAAHHGVIRYQETDGVH
jgi:hypothetical protein